MYCTAVHVRVAKVISQEISEISVGKCLGNPLTRVTRSDTNSLQQDNDFRWKHWLREYSEHKYFTLVFNKTTRSLNKSLGIDC